ncbi:hypothetical protein [Microvirga sp. 17 mud 1-3]|uniref:hypothetical protein n=1 Tax=Microvirga sp. 17 mud 1-3 TaxID=2082949 RepID=UPI000D6CD310|nr:hypothetical protein [Microvirga sp. 17 mud 1-3]AWM86638.1 hypothetical protein C4E04_07780 [Microvirga sp. 17 mud 1-3]
MLPQTLVALFLAGSALTSEKVEIGRELMIGAVGSSRETAAQYLSEAREVTNWRTETVDALEPKPVALLAALFRADRPLVTRCVKLNNYWCIKSARWDGEIGKDTEGHVGFASAERGADAAAQLLRRYYLDFNRKSALDIVRRWAPAECNVATGIGDLAALAVKGIGGTVRARWLASHRGVKLTAVGKGGKPGRVSVVIPLKKAPSRVPEYRVPDIAAGMGEKARPAPKPAPLVRTARQKAPPQKTAAAPAQKAAPVRPVATACAPDEQRLRNYAARMVAELELGPTDDLKLFGADGTPTANLAPVMRAMSAVELGMLRASPDLVEEAIRRLGERVAAKRAAADENP